MGKVIGIAAHNEYKGPMVVYASAKVSFDQGIADDIRGAKQNNRQVTILRKEDWSTVCAEIGSKLHWTTRRANILVEGIDLENSTGKLLKIGRFHLEITGELWPCERMDAEMLGLTQALTPNWRGGVTCRLLSEGVVNEGDEVSFFERPTVQ
ncbi:MAG: MOSC domain-containing protein YiiM [Crocinitomicaceae bacterium]|jgi:MOSC domain-containing protein YiiM